MDEFRAAVVQMNSGMNRNQNLCKIEDFVAKAKDMEADLVIFPETVDYIGDNIRENAWDRKEAEHFFGNLAKEYQIYLHCGSITEQTKDNPKNTTLFFSSEGICIGRYSKLHMFDIQMGQGLDYRESDQIQAGDQISVVHTPFGILGFAICYDIRFGEMFRLMAQRGATLLCVSANFTKDTGRDHWEVLLRTRAIENACYILAANQIGEKSRFASYGNSMIIDPWGNILAQCKKQEGIVIADIKRNVVEQIRKKIPVLYNLRQDMYQLHGKVKIWNRED